MQEPPGGWRIYCPPVRLLPWLEAGEEATSLRPLTVRRRRTAPAAACTAPPPPARRGRSPRSPGPGSRREWSPWCLLPGGPTPSGSRGKHNVGQAAGGKGSWFPQEPRAWLGKEPRCAGCPPAPCPPPTQGLPLPHSPRAPQRS